MPNKCSECPFCNLAGKRMERLLCMFTLKSEVRELIDNRLPECPLVELPENEDAISRQGAIDVAFDIFPDDEYFREQFVKSIEALPSTQPENIRCKDCKYAINNGTSEMMCKNSRTRVVDTNNNFGCIFAERRTNE